MRSLQAIALVSLLSWPGIALAGEISATAPITAVTVYPDRAQVTRGVSFNLPAGEHSLIIADLPAGLFPDSLRAEGSGPSGMAIGSIELRRRISSDLVRERERRLVKELQGLRDAMRLQDDTIRAARIELDFITALGREVPRRENEDLGAGELDIESLASAWERIGQGAARTLRRIQESEIEKRDLQLKAQKVERELQQVRTGQRQVFDAVVQVVSDNPGEAKVNLQYQLRGASWRPLYDARLDSENGNLVLVQRGEVRQSTGEDWTNVALTLSTSRPGRGTAPPHIDPWFVNFRGPVLADNAEMRTMALQSLAKGANAPVAAAEPMAEEEADNITAQAQVGTFSAAYLIPGESSVSADNSPQKFTIKEEETATKLQIRAVPKYSTEAFLLGQIDYQGEAPLLPGPVAIFRDGAFVGRSNLALTRPGETVDLAFGADEKVAIEYRLLKGERSEEGLINKDQRHERRYRFTVTNHHKQAIEVTLMDHLPVAQDERIKVELLRGTTQPSARDVDNKTGVLAWTRDYQAGEEATIDFGYAISYPQEMQLPDF